MVLLLEKEMPPLLVEVEGKIVRKKKRKHWVVIAIKHDLSIPAVNAYISKTKNTVVSCHNYELNAFLDTCDEFLYLEAVVKVRGFYSQKPAENGAEEETIFYVDEIQLVLCAPDPSAVAFVLTSLAQQEYRYDPSTLLLDDVHDPQEDAIRRLSQKPRQRRLAIAELVRRLQGLEPRPARNRLPQLRKSDLQLLESMEELGRSPTVAWDLLEPKPVEYAEVVESLKPEILPLNLPPSDAVLFKDSTFVFDSSQPVSSRANRTRVEYLVRKKHPQIQWMVQRVQALLGSQSPTSGDGPIPIRHHILDVGGGRGDLATALALAFPDCLVTVVDRNHLSLEAGRLYAEQIGLLDRMFFIHADFREYHQDPLLFYASEERDFPPPVNLVVALHACGDLSDLALAHAQERSCPFVICPCCYTKKNISDFSPPWCSLVENVGAGNNDEAAEAEDPICVLVRLAELNERPEIGRRAMTVINSMRLFNLASQGSYCSVALEEYESKATKRNIVLVGA